MSCLTYYASAIIAPAAVTLYAIQKAREERIENLIVGNKEASPNPIRVGLLEGGLATLAQITGLIIGNGISQHQ